MVAGYLLLNQNLVTGTNNQLAHYYRPLSVFYVFVLVDGIRRVTGRATWEPGVRAAVFSLLLAWVLIRGVAGAWTLSNLISGPDGYTPAAAKFHRTLAAIRDLPEAMKGLTPVCRT
jgi:hypothetical protein